MSRYPEGIPIVRNDGWHPGPRDISSTPGGTMYATTPGGTRILYQRDALLQLRNSPLSKTPTNTLPVIPGVTAPVDAKPSHVSHPPIITAHDPSDADEDEVFQMDK